MATTKHNVGHFLNYLPHWNIIVKFNCRGMFTTTTEFYVQCCFFWYLRHEEKPEKKQRKHENNKFKASFLYFTSFFCALDSPSRRRKRERKATQARFINNFAIIKIKREREMKRAWRTEGSGFMFRHHSPWRY